MTGAGTSLPADLAQLTDVVEEAAKLKWLTDRLPGFIDQGDALVFASQKLRVDDLTEKLKAAGFRWASVPASLGLCMPSCDATRRLLVLLSKQALPVRSAWSPAAGLFATVQHACVDMQKS